MTLVGRYRSPFTRRVAITLRLLEIEYEHRPYTAWSNLTEVRAVNPVGRIPALILGSGETRQHRHPGLPGPDGGTQSRAGSDERTRQA
jgi:glutathione S-transferase